MLSIRAKEFEKRLRSIVRSELRATPAAWEEFRRRRFKALPRRLLALSMCIAMPFGAVLMPLSFSLPVIGMGVIADQGRFAGQDNGTEFMLGIHGLQLFSLLLLVAGGNNRAYGPGSADNVGWAIPQMYPRVMAHYPIRDADLNCALWWVTWPWIAWLLAAFSGLVYGYLAWKFQLGGSALAMPAFIWIVHMAVFLAACAIAGGYGPTDRLARKSFVLVGAGLFVSTFMVGMSGLLLPAGLWEVVRATLYVTPTSWTSAAYLHAVLGGDPGGWWWLAPAGVVLLAGMATAAAMVRAGFSIREYIISPIDGRWYGVIGRGFRVPLELPPPPPLVHNRRDQPRPEPTLLVEADAFEAAAGLSDDFVPPAAPWEFLDRWCDRLLTPRERLALAVWSSYRVLTRQWLSLATGAVLAAALIELWVKQPLERKDQQIWLVVFPVFAALMCRFGWTNGLASGWANFVAIYPLGVNEVFRAAFKHNLVRCASFLPVAIWYGWTVANEVGATPWDGVVPALAIVGLLASFQPMLDCAKISVMTNDTQHWWGWAFWIGGGVPLGLASFVVLMAEPLTRKFSALAVAAALSWAMSTWYRRAYRKGRFDVLVGRFRDR